VEKQVTTPQAYPLSLLAVVAACNQSSNRDPVLALDEREVEAALTSLRQRGLTRLVHPRHGRGVTKYRQVLDEALDLDAEARAVLCLLLLRGPQTPAELRARAERLADLATVADVEATLDRLAGRDDPLVVRLARRPGQKEARVAQLLTGPVDDADPAGDPGGESAPMTTRPAPAPADPVGSPWPPPPLPAAPGATTPAPTGDGGRDGGTGGTAGAGQATELDELRGEVAALRGEVADLARRLSGLEG
jgi:hypothetical protein